MSINGKSILIIDDDAAMLRALTKVLSGEGAAVTSASWAGEAMDHLTDKLERYEVIITDLRMPILGGETILRAVAAALPQVPVIVMTAFGTPEIKAECLRNGAVAFLEKPLDTRQLIEVIDYALSGAKTNCSVNSSRHAQHRRGVKRARAAERESQADFSSSRRE